MLYNVARIIRRDGKKTEFFVPTCWISVVARCVAERPRATAEISAPRCPKGAKRHFGQRSRISEVFIPIRQDKYYVQIVLGLLNPTQIHIKVRDENLGGVPTSLIISN